METLREDLLFSYRKVRRASVDMCAPLSPEDYQVQTMEEVSPPKWNLGHTSWFFYNFLLGPLGLALPEDDKYKFYLNSYYHKAGKMGQRGRRGLVTRPTVGEVYRYRDLVDERVERFIAGAEDRELREKAFLLTVGINHEQQHQELFYTEIKNIYFQNPPKLRPAYARPGWQAAAKARPAASVDFPGGIYRFGNVAGGWCWDNELGCHSYCLGGFGLMDRLVTSGEYMEFMEDGGYSNIFLWLSDGWAEKEKQGWRAPLYWENTGGEWRAFTLSGMRRVDPAEPVCHVSFYEASAFAKWKSETDGRWAGARLPTEHEWEHAARQAGGVDGNFLDTGLLHPAPCKGGAGGMGQMFGDVWEWTTSHYGPYPGFREFPGGVSEYNGKFMNNQRVLRGGSCVTPAGHVRASYRNFWHPATRFQFAGMRLAKDLER